MIDTLSKVAEYKIKLEKPVAFLFIGIKHAKREVTAMLHSQWSEMISRNKPDHGDDEPLQWKL